MKLLLIQFEGLIASAIGALMEKGGPYAVLAILVLILFVLGKTLITPLFDWTKEKWVRRVTIEDGLRKQMQEMSERLNKLESYVDRVQDEIPAIGRALHTEMDRPEVNREIVRFYADRLVTFKGVDNEGAVGAG